MYGTCETLCRELVAQYPGNTPLMLVVWSPEEIQALTDGMAMCSAGESCPRSGGGLPVSPR
ncbi:DUF1380 domain-containing protein [Escherichia coli]|nr:DUF1380 domain-containing protein [Escherichia coli]NGA79212.1 DUF1380 domain-containing protein [Escherichia coli]